MEERAEGFYERGLLPKTRFSKEQCYIALKSRKNRNKIRIVSPAPLAPCLLKRHEMYGRIPRLLLDLVSSRTELLVKKQK
jgi:hypothetical protein